MPEKTTEEKVEVPKSFIENLQKEMKEMKESQNMLFKIADKRQLAKYFERNRKKLPSIIQLRMIDEKVVVGWRMKEDKGSFQNPITGAWTEYQKIEVMFEDGKSQEYHLRDFNRIYRLTPATLVSTITDEKSGNLIVELKRNDNGKVYKVDIRYVN